MLTRKVPSSTKISSLQSAVVSHLFGRYTRVSPNLPVSSYIFGRQTDAFSVLSPLSIGNSLTQHRNFTTTATLYAGKGNGNRVEDDEEEYDSADEIRGTKSTNGTMTKASPPSSIPPDDPTQITVKAVSDYVVQLEDKIVQIMDDDENFFDKLRLPLTQEEKTEMYFSDEYTDIEEQINEVSDVSFPYGIKLAYAYQNVQLNVRSSDEVFKLTGIVRPSVPLPTPLRQGLIEQINKYVQKPTTLIDYHPGSDTKVQDIVHPSLYPYVHGLSILEKDTDPALTAVFTNKDKVSYEQDRWGRDVTYSQRYQWLPSEFFIDKNGKVLINSYINNLPTEETELYKLIGQAFEHVLPAFEQTYSYANEMQFYVEEDGSNDPSEDEVTIPRGTNALRNRNLQVITKIVRIKLASSDTTKYRSQIRKDASELIGAWHAEGMSNEHIVATATLTLAKDPMFSSTLYFKRNYLSDEAATFQSRTPQNPPFYVYEFLRQQYVPLGKIHMNENDITVFPNSHVHKIDMRYDPDNGIPLRTRWKTAEERTKIPLPPFVERTIVVFWLIDPEIEILSTKHVKEQQKYNPAFTLEKAFEHRLELMKERSKVKQTYQQNELNLCEH